MKPGHSRRPDLGPIGRIEQGGKFCHESKQTPIKQNPDQAEKPISRKTQFNLFFNQLIDASFIHCQRCESTSLFDGALWHGRSAPY